MLLNLRNFFRSTSFQCVQHMVELTQPLKQIGVDYFSRVELLPDGQFSCLLNNDTWPAYYIKHQLCHIDPLTFSQQDMSSGLYLVDLDFFGQQSEQHRLFTQLERDINHIRLMGCFTHIHSNGNRIIYNWGSSFPFFRNYEWIEAFIHYFEDKAQALLRKADFMAFPTTQKLQKKNDKCLVFFPNTKLTAKNKKKNQELSLEFNFMQYYSVVLGKEYGLSTRETECLRFLIQGKLIKQIAAELKISVRTVDTYIETMKVKLGCRTKIDVVLKAMRRQLGPVTQCL